MTSQGHLHKFFSTCEPSPDSWSQNSTLFWAIAFELSLSWTVFRSFHSRTIGLWKLAPESSFSLQLQSFGIWAVAICETGICLWSWVSWFSFFYWYYHFLIIWPQINFVQIFLWSLLGAVKDLAVGQRVIKYLLSGVVGENTDIDQIHNFQEWQIVDDVHQS